MGNDLAVAVVGPTGLVGREILGLLRERMFPFREVRLLGSPRSAGKRIADESESEQVQLLGPKSFDGVDIAFFAAGPAVADEWAPQAARTGATVIDCSSRFRLQDEVPLVVPEVNAASTRKAMDGLVANPSGVAIGLSVVLAPLVERAGVRRVIASTYQGVAGAGQRALDALSHETMDLLNSRSPRARRFARRIAFNCVPQVGELTGAGPTTHEVAVAHEVRKILGLAALPVHVTAVRVPVFFGVGLSVVVETERPLAALDAAECLRAAPGLIVHAEASDPYPTPIEAAGEDATHVGRVRRDDALPNGLALWVVLDSVRKGAALNAVQVAEIVARDLD